MSGRLPTVSLCLGAIAACLGCRLVVDAPRGYPLPAKPTGAVEETDPHPGKDLRAALLSVYYHAWIVDHPPPPGGPVSMPVVGAAEILSGEHGLAAASRRRRAIVLLSVYGGKRTEHREAVGRLLAREVSGRNLEPDALPQMQRAEVRGVQRALATTVETTRKETTNPLVVEERAANELAQRLPEMADWCERTWAHTLVRYDPFMGDTRAETRFWVRKPLDTLAISLDPQNWARCNPFFVSSFYLPEGPPPNRCVTKTEPPQDPTPPLKGQSAKGLLFEHFVFDLWGVHWSWFRNVIAIDATRDGSGYRYRYDLHDSQCSRVLWETGSGGFGVDGGYMEVTPSEAWLLPKDDGWYEVAATKGIVFSGRPTWDWWLDWWGPPLLWLLGHETAEQACYCEG